MEGRNWGHQPKCHACENIHSHFGLSCLFTWVFVCAHLRLFLCVLHRGFVRRFRPGSPGAPDLFVCPGVWDWTARMGSRGDFDFGAIVRLVGLRPTRTERSQCDWCGWWGHFSWPMPAKFVLIDVDMPPPQGPTVVCLRCIGLDEPPWRPNNRERWQRLLSRHTPLDDNCTRLIALFIAALRA